MHEIQFVQKKDSARRRRQGVMDEAYYNADGERDKTKSVNWTEDN